MIDPTGPGAGSGADTGVGAAGTRRLRVALRVVSWVTFAVLGAGGVLLFAAALLTGFSRPRRLPAALLVCWALFAVLVAVGRWLRARLRARGVDAPAAHSRRFTQMPRAGWVVLSTLWGIAELTLVGIGAQVAVPAYELGAHPALTEAVSVVNGPNCVRCARPVIVEFTTARGATVTARLAAADGTQHGDGPGEVLAYDPARPARVMRASDWRDGRSGTPGVLLLVALGMLAAQVAVTVLRVRGRRARFGQLRPGTGIAMVSTRRVRGGIAWRVEFADGAAASYVDSARVQAALRERVLSEGGASGHGTRLSDAACERLGVRRRTDGVDGWAERPASTPG